MGFQVEGGRNDVVWLPSGGVVLRFGDPADPELSQGLLVGIVRHEIPVSREKHEPVGLHRTHTGEVAPQAGIGEGHPLPGSEGVAQHVERTGLHFDAGREWLADRQQPDIPLELADRGGGIGIERRGAERAHTGRCTAKRETLIGRDRQHRQRLIADPLRPRDRAHFDRGHDARFTQRQKGQVERRGQESITGLATIAIGQRLDGDPEGAEFVLVALEGAQDTLFIDAAGHVAGHIATQVGEHGAVVATQQRREQIEPAGQFIGGSHTMITQRTTCRTTSRSAPHEPQIVGDSVSE